MIMLTVNISLSTTPPLVTLAPFLFSISVYLLVLSSALHPLDKRCAVSCFFFCSLSSISTIITFHPAEYGDGNNLTLLLQGDTIPL